MKQRAWTGAALPAVLALVLAGAACVYVSGQEHAAEASAESPDWIADRADCICGLDDPRLLSNPAVVDYGRCLYATTEMKRMREENIDPQSPRGIQLAAQAADRVRGAAESVRSQFGHCSVWKTIRHRDGRAVPDRTADVLAALPQVRKQLGSSEGAAPP